MFNNIERTLAFFPYACLVLLVLALVFLEIKNRKEMLVDRPCAEPGRGGFVPPSGDGYEYYVSRSTIVYILRKAKNRFRVYLIQGGTPNARMKHDKYGQYFTIHCENTSAAEKIIDNAFDTASA